MRGGEEALPGSSLSFCSRLPVQLGEYHFDTGKKLFPKQLKYLDHTLMYRSPSPFPSQFTTLSCCTH